MGIRKVVLVVLFWGLMFFALGVRCGAYHSSVYYPSGTTYIINIEYCQIAISNESTSIRNTTLNVEVMLVSKDLDLNYVGWGFYINGTGEEYENGTKTEEREVDFSIPPILIAAKKNTRELHPTDLLMDIMSGEFDEAEISTILSSAYTARPIDELFMYNIFYIESGSKPGDTIIFGFVNSSSNEEATQEFEISYERKIEIPGGEIETLVIDIDVEDVENIGGIIDEDINVSIASYLRLYYEKETGWLVRVEGYGESTGKGENENVTEKRTISLNMSLKDPGSIPITGSRGLNGILGTPKFTMEALALITIVVIVYLKLIRRGL